MDIRKLHVGQIVFDVQRRKMGNTTLSSTDVFTVRIIEIDPYFMWVKASWNSNPPQRYHAISVRRWRKKEPTMITGMFGSQRLATRAELKAAKGEE